MGISQIPPATSPFMRHKEFLFIATNDEARGNNHVWLMISVSFDFWGIESSYSLQGIREASSMVERLGGIQGDYGFESRAFYHILSAPYFAA